MTLTVGSLFSGIGGLDLGLERAGMKVLWQVEIDPYAQRVLAKHWPDIPRFSDIREVGANQLAPVDLICGGFPCQDVSNAGKRVGIDGERSGLWREFLRVIREIRPRYVLVENVAALLARGLGRVLGDLAESGFDAEWDCIPAAALGAPHRRDRLFVVAYACGADGRRQSESQSRRSVAPIPSRDGPFGPLADAAGDGWQQGSSQRTRLHRQAGCGGTSDALRGGQRGGAVPHANGLRPQEPRVFGVSPGQAGTIANPDWWTTEPHVGRVAHGVPSRVDRIKGLGNAVVPQVAEFLGRQILRTAQARAA